MVSASRCARVDALARFGCFFLAAFTGFYRRIASPALVGVRKSVMAFVMVEIGAPV